MIPITPDYKITIDERCFTLKQRKVKGADEKSLSRLADASTAGEEYWSDVGYFLDIDQALRRFTHVELSKAKNLADVRKRLGEIREVIAQVQKALEVGV